MVFQVFPLMIIWKCLIWHESVKMGYQETIQSCNFKVKVVTMISFIIDCKLLLTLISFIIYSAILFWFTCSIHIRAYLLEPPAYFSAPRSSASWQSYVPCPPSENRRNHHARLPLHRRHVLHMVYLIIIFTKLLCWNLII